MAHQCDRCGYEPKNFGLGLELIQGGLFKTNIKLCVSCFGFVHKVIGMMVRKRHMPKSYHTMAKRIIKFEKKGVYDEKTLDPQVREKVLDLIARSNSTKPRGKARPNKKHR